MTRGLRPGSTWQDRFFRHVSFDGTSCWVWTGHRNSNGYGAFYAGRPAPGDAPRAHEPAPGRALAHRFAYHAMRGPTTKPCLIHSCDRRECVNPWHLTDATPAENSADMVAKGRAAKMREVSLVHAPKGVKQWKAKLTDDLVREARRRRAAGESARSIASGMGVTPITIRRVTTTHWRHVA